MGWSLGYDSSWNRGIGYGVPATCDHPGCGVEIDRGLGYVCGGDPYGGEHGCGLFFCSAHLFMAGRRRGYRQLCKCCLKGRGVLFEPSADVPDWMKHKLADESWAAWRAENPQGVAAIRAALGKP